LQWQLWRYHFAMLRAVRLARFPGRAWARTANRALRAFVWARKELVAEAFRGMRALLR
jgi:hypothetical protein